MTDLAEKYPWRPLSDIIAEAATQKDKTHNVVAIRYLRRTRLRRWWQNLHGQTIAEFIYCPTSGDLRLRRKWE